MIKTSTHNKKIALFAATLLIISFTAFYVYGSFNKVIGYNNIKYKRMSNNNYYIFVRNGNRDIKLECNKDDFERIAVDSNLAYSISYEWSMLLPNRGTISYINFNDVIDNR